MIKKIAALSSVTIAASYLYVKVREKRSYKSFLHELKLRITNTKSSFENVENAQKSLDAVKEQTNGLYDGTDYHFKHKIQATTVQQSTVYTVNDQIDRQQQVVLYIHGGAWFQDPLKYHFDYIDTLASELGAKIVLPIYPKVPHATYKETFTLLKEIYENIVREVEDPHQIIVMGDSAGGQIALSFAQYIKMQELPQPSNIIMISPVLDGTLSNPESVVYEKIDPMLAREGSKFFLELWSGDLPLTDWHISPMFGDLEGLGHITLVIGTKETLYPDALKLSNMLNKQNIAHDFIPGYNLFHIYPVFPIPERTQVITKLKQIIKKY